jgi:hypothetical protein
LSYDVAEIEGFAAKLGETGESGCTVQLGESSVQPSSAEGFSGLVDRVSDLTMTLCWATSKRAWSVSRGFKELEYDTLDETSPCDGSVDLSAEGTSPDLIVATMIALTKAMIDCMCRCSEAVIFI